MLPIVKVALPAADELMPALEKTLYSGQISEGEQVYEFEKQFSEKFNINNVLAMSSGTAALHAALKLCGVEPGDEVISTPMTAEPTNLSILYCGAKVVWADIDPQLGGMDPESVRSKITDKTKAILCVHYAGYPVNLAELKSIANQHGIPLIEDCAHALGALYAGKHVGLMGDYAIYSFQAIKHMTTIDGGVLTMVNPEKMEEAKKFRWFGMLKGVPRTEVNISSVGYKYNMNNVVATIGMVQLRSISSVLQRHIENGKYFDEMFSKVAGVDFARCDLNAEPSYWLYTLLSDDSVDLEKALNAAGISASKLHRPNNSHSIFDESKTDLPGLDKFYKRLLHLPCGWWVNDEDRALIVETVKKG